jgi:hypothetical protein
MPGLIFKNAAEATDFTDEHRLSIKYKPISFRREVNGFDPNITLNFVRIRGDPWNPWLNGSAALLAMG